MYGSYSFIMQSLNNFDESRVNMVVESLQPQDITYFPSVGVCELGHTKEPYDHLDVIVNG